MSTYLSSAVVKKTFERDDDDDDGIWSQTTSQHGMQFFILRSMFYSAVSCVRACVRDFLIFLINYDDDDDDDGQLGWVVEWV